MPEPNGTAPHRGAVPGPATRQPLRGGVAVPRIHVDEATYRELELIALAWNTTVGDALARLIADLSRSGTDRAHGALNAVHQERKRNP